MYSVLSIFRVLDDIFPRLYPADGAGPGQNPYPVRRNDEQEYRHHQREEASGALTSGYALRQIQEKFQDHFDKALESAGNFGEPASHHESNYQQDDNRDPSRDHRIGNWDVRVHRLGGNRDSRERRPQKTESESLAQCPAKYGDYKYYQPYRQYQQRSWVTQQL